MHHHLNYSHASVWLAFEEPLYSIYDFGLWYLKFVNVLKELREESKRSIGYYLFPPLLCVKRFAQLFNNMKHVILYIYIKNLLI